MSWFSFFVAPIHTFRLYQPKFEKNSSERERIEIAWKKGCCFLVLKVEKTFLVKIIFLFKNYLSSSGMVSPLALYHLRSFTNFGLGTLALHVKKRFLPTALTCGPSGLMTNSLDALLCLWWRPVTPETRS